MTTYAEAGRALRHACAKRDLLAAEHGPRAVAEAAMWPGHPLGVDGIEQYYRALQDRERERLGRKAA